MFIKRHTKMDRFLRAVETMSVEHYSKYLNIDSATVGSGLGRALRFVWGAQV